MLNFILFLISVYSKRASQTLIPISLQFLTTCIDLHAWEIIKTFTFLPTILIKTEIKFKNIFFVAKKTQKTTTKKTPTKIQSFFNKISLWIYTIKKETSEQKNINCSTELLNSYNNETKTGLGVDVKLVKITYGFNYYTFQLTGSSVKSTTGTCMYCIKITHEYISYLKKCTP